MRTLLLTLLVCVFPGVALADGGDDTLLMYFSRSDVVVLGEFTSEPVGESTEGGVIHYLADFKVAQLIKGEERGNRKVGGTIRVNVIRFEFDPEDRLPELKKGGKCILFLKVDDKQEKATHLSADVWFGVQRPNPTMVRSLKRVSARLISVKGLSDQGRRTFERVAPIPVATAYLSREKIDISKYDIDMGYACSYCPPQATVYDWLVTFPSRTGEDPLFVAVTNAHKAWRLDAKNLERID